MRDDEFPDWLLRSDCPPPEVREKLAAMLPTGPDAYYAIDNLCLIAHDFASTNVEQRRYQSVYNRQKPRSGSKNPHPGTQHAGEELERIRDAAMELHDARAKLLAKCQYIVRLIQIGDQHAANLHGQAAEDRCGGFLGKIHRVDGETQRKSQPADARLHEKARFGIVADPRDLD